MQGTNTMENVEWDETWKSYGKVMTVDLGVHHNSNIPHSVRTSPNSKPRRVRINIYSFAVFFVRIKRSCNMFLLRTDPLKHRIQLEYVLWFQDKKNSHYKTLLYRTYLLFYIILFITFLIIQWKRFQRPSDVQQYEDQITLGGLKYKI